MAFTEAIIKKRLIAMVAYDLRKRKNHKTVQIATTNVADKQYRCFLLPKSIF